jgi:hypothetical protein
MNSNPSSDPLAQSPAATPAPEAVESKGAQSEPATPAVPELGGRKDGTEPTRYGDWEKHGRCIDF